MLGILRQRSDFIRNWRDFCPASNEANTRTLTILSVVYARGLTASGSAPLSSDYANSAGLRVTILRSSFAVGEGTQRAPRKAANVAHSDRARRRPRSTLLAMNREGRIHGAAGGDHQWSIEAASSAMS
jgi:hypothetical protein